MAYRVSITTSAERGLRRIDAQHHARILADMHALANGPRPHGSKKIEPKSAGQYVTRVGIHYRVLYTIDDAAKSVVVLRVGTRENFY